MNISGSADYTRNAQRPEDLQFQLSSLRDCICDLLVTNQRLRMALMEGKERAMRPVEMEEPPRAC